MSYTEIYRRSLNDKEEFWAEHARSLHWYKPWEKVLDLGESEFPRWFAGGEINACYNCIDRHVEAGFGEEPAIIYESAATGVSQKFSLGEMRELTAKLGGALRAHGLEKGDRALIYMPNSPHALTAMLACARIGAIHSVVFGGFSARELATRIDDAKPKVILAASCGIEGSKVIAYQPILQDAFELADHRPNAVFYWQREQEHADLATDFDYDWDAETKMAKRADCVPVAATDPLYILYTSGTTGQPKGIVRDTGGHLVSLLWSMNGIYNCPSGEVFWAASDVGWVVGHSYICYGPLLNRNPTVIFEGKPVGMPDAGVFWRILAKHNVRTFFTAPTALRAIRQADPDGRLVVNQELSRLRSVFLAGERTDPETLHWIGNILGVPVIDHWWQTETGSAITANPLGIEEMPIKSGASCVSMPGWDLACLDDAGNALPANESGAIAARLPLPPGFAKTLWNAPDRFRVSYFSHYPGWYLTGDSGFIDEDGYVHVMARIDDVINVAGHRLSSSAMEEALAQHPAVVECAVIGVSDPLKGQVPVGLVVLKHGTSEDPEAIKQQLIASIRETIGPVAAFRTAHIVSRLPKTRSGKILRKSMRQLADGLEPEIPATIEDPAVLTELKAIL